MDSLQVEEVADPGSWSADLVSLRKCCGGDFTAGLAQAGAALLRGERANLEGRRARRKIDVFENAAKLGAEHPGYVLVQHDLVRPCNAKERARCPSAKARKQVKQFEVVAVGGIVRRKLAMGRGPFDSDGDAHCYYDVEGGAPVKPFFDFDGAFLVKDPNDDESVEHGWRRLRDLLKEFKARLRALLGEVTDWMAFHLCAENRCSKPSAHAHDLMACWAEDVYDLALLVQRLRREASPDLQRLLDDGVYSRGRAFRMPGMCKWDLDDDGQDVSPKRLRWLDESPCRQLSGSSAVRLFDQQREAYELLLFPHVLHPATPELGVRLERGGGKRAAAPTADISPSKRARSRAPLVATLPAHLVPKVVSLTRHLSAERATDYSTWIRVLLALKSCGDDPQLLRAFQAFSRCSPTHREVPMADLARR
jgi:hypothetical protein